MSVDILGTKLANVASVIDSSSMSVPIAEKGRREVSALDVEAFSRLLTSPSISGVGSAASSSVVPTMKTPVLGGVAPADAPAGAPLLGETILDSLQKVGTDVRNQWQKVTEVTQARAIDDKPSVSELLAAQLQVSKVVFATEMTSTVIKKVSTVVDSIVHMQ